VLVSFSAFFMDIPNPEDETRLPHNVGRQSPNDVAPNLRTQTMLRRMIAK
jgi:hypothetical protein